MADDGEEYEEDATGWETDAAGLLADFFQEVPESITSNVEAMLMARMPVEIAAAWAYLTWFDHSDCVKRTHQAATQCLAGWWDAFPPLAEE